MWKWMVIVVLTGPLSLAQSPGEIVGWTQYDHQENASGSNRIAMDSQDGIHVCWTRGWSIPTRRQIYYNYRNPQGIWTWPGAGIQISESDNSGFCNLDIGPGDCSAVFYHAPAYGPRIRVYTDCDGYHSFTLPDSGLAWPKATINLNGRFHVIAGTSDPFQIASQKYNFSSDLGNSWGDWINLPGRGMLMGITSSCSSQRTAIVFGMPIHPAQPDEYDKDIAYLVSEDGVTWDFDNPIRITNYDTSLERAVSDCDLIFDRTDNLHIVWNTYQIDPDSRRFNNASTLWHWSESSNQITEISSFGSTSCDPGLWNLALAKMSLGIDSSDNLFCVWTGFLSDDHSDVDPNHDTTFCNGDLYMSYSIDQGLTWSIRQNITVTRTPDCAAGQCDSDNWATLAEEVDDYLHVLYVDDKDAGSMPISEGEITDNPIRYLEIPNPLSSQIIKENILPRDIQVLRCYPNPFNATTLLQFSLRHACQVDLRIYDIAGRLVQVIQSRYLLAGGHEVIWDAGNYSSGVYLGRLSAGDASASIKLVISK